MIIYDGHINEGELERLRFNINDLLEELRTDGYYNIEDVQIAVLETNGKLSVIPRPAARNVTLSDIKQNSPKSTVLPYTIVSDGSYNLDEIDRWGKTRDEAEAYLKAKGWDNVKDIFIASVGEKDRLYIQQKGKRDRPLTAKKQLS